MRKESLSLYRLSVRLTGRLGIKVYYIDDLPALNPPVQTREAGSALLPLAREGKHAILFLFVRGIVQVVHGDQLAGLGGRPGVSDNVAAGGAAERRVSLWIYSREERQWPLAMGLVVCTSLEYRVNAPCVMRNTAQVDAGMH